MGVLSSRLRSKPPGKDPPAMRTYSFGAGNSSESKVKASTFSLFFVFLSAFALLLAIGVHNFAPEPLCAREENLSSRMLVLVCLPGDDPSIQLE